MGGLRRSGPRRDLARSVRGRWCPTWTGHLDRQRPGRRRLLDRNRRLSRCRLLNRIRQLVQTGQRDRDLDRHRQLDRDRPGRIRCHPIQARLRLLRMQGRAGPVPANPLGARRQRRSGRVPGTVRVGRTVTTGLEDMALAQRVLSSRHRDRRCWRPRPGDRPGGPSLRSRRTDAVRQRTIGRGTYWCAAALRLGECQHRRPLAGAEKSATGQDHRKGWAGQANGQRQRPAHHGSQPYRLR